MVARLSAAVEDQILDQVRPAAETVVEVDVGARAVVHNVAINSFSLDLNCV